LFEMVHKMDQPWNAWPSLHIAHSYFLAHAITRWVKAGHGDSTGSRLFLLVLWVEFVLLCISILTTKQHYIWDLGTGLLVGFIGWRIAQPVLDSIRALPDAEIHPFPNH
ncbi:MAG: phosphatase PAP2 family protein, partial [Candidatus Poseidoniia archaeon]